MRNFSRESKFTYIEPIDINISIQNSLVLLEKKLRDDGINILKSLEPDMPCCLGSSNQLEQVMLNLISNAKDALIGVDEPILKITSYRRDDNLIIEVEDNGVGIKKEASQNIFDPFFTTKETGKGTGLGLSISKSIIDRFNGLIDFRPGQDQGVAFIITIPVAPMEDQNTSTEFDMTIQDMKKPERV